MPGEFQFVQGTKHYVDRLDDLTWGDVGHCRLQFPSQCFSETKFPDFGVERERKREAAESRLFRALRVIGESLSCDSLQAMNVGDKYVTGAAYSDARGMWQWSADTTRYRFSRLSNGHLYRSRQD